MPNNGTIHAEAVTYRTVYMLQTPAPKPIQPPITWRTLDSFITVAIPILLLVFVWVLIKSRRRK